MSSLSYDSFHKFCYVTLQSRFFKLVFLVAQDLIYVSHRDQIFIFLAFDKGRL